MMKHSAGKTGARQRALNRTGYRNIAGTPQAFAIWGASMAEELRSRRQGGHGQLEASELFLGSKCFYSVHCNGDLLTNYIRNYKGNIYIYIYIYIYDLP